MDKSYYEKFTEHTNDDVKHQGLFSKYVKFRLFLMALIGVGYFYSRDLINWKLSTLISLPEGQPYVFDAVVLLIFMYLIPIKAQSIRRKEFPANWEK